VHVRVQRREITVNIHAHIGDEIVVDSMQLGHPKRRGQVLEVIADGDVEHYRVAWDDGHESVFFPGTTSHVVHLGHTA
jgi:hypothetical protein